jgi:hypothetical protein
MKGDIMYPFFSLENKNIQNYGVSHKTLFPFKDISKYYQDMIIL